MKSDLNFHNHNFIFSQTDFEWKVSLNTAKQKKGAPPKHKLKKQKKDDLFILFFFLKGKGRRIDQSEVPVLLVHQHLSN